MLQSEKFFRLITILVFATTLALIGCDDSTGSDDSEVGLIGSWRHTGSMTYYGSSIANADSMYDNSDYAAGYVDTYTDEQNDGMRGYSTWDGGDIVYWRYTATDSTITYKYCGGDPCDPKYYHLTYEISGLTLILTFHDEPEWHVDMYRRE